MDSVTTRSVIASHIPSQSTFKAVTILVKATLSTQKSYGFMKAVKEFVCSIGQAVRMEPSSATFAIKPATLTSRIRLTDFA